MAVVILGGLVTSTILNLLLLPSLYSATMKPRRGATPPQEAKGMAVHV